MRSRRLGPPLLPHHGSSRLNHSITKAMDRLAKQARTSLTPELSPHSDVVPPPSPQVPPSLTSIPSEVAAADGEARVSFYVQSIDEMLERVLDQESFLFTSVERTALERFQSMGCECMPCNIMDRTDSAADEARYLFMRLYLRKHTWIRGDTIGYESDISDVDATCDALCEKVVWGEEEEEVREKGQVKKAEEIDLTASQDTVIDLTVSDDEEEMDLVDNTQPAAGEMTAAEERAELSRIAFDEDVLAESPAEDILAILKLDELADLGRRLKVVAKRGTVRPLQLYSCIRTHGPATSIEKGMDTSASQDLHTIDTYILHESSVEEGQGEGEPSWRLLRLEGEETHPVLCRVFPRSQDYRCEHSFFCRPLLTAGSAGPCIRITPAYVSLFDRLSLIYHRTAYSSSSGISSLTSSLLARFGKRNYPTYVVSRSFSIFPSRHLLRQYEDALQIEFKVEEALGENWKTAPASSGPRTEVEKKGDREAMWEEGIRLFESIRAAWGGMCVEEEGKGEGEEGKLMYYRRRFHPGWPLTRVVYKAAAILARLVSLVTRSPHRK
jgi:Fanconi-associated nuclease 1